MSRLFQHFQEQQEGQFGHIFTVGHCVISQDVTEAPELSHDVGGAGHRAVILHISSLIPTRMLPSSPSNTLLSRSNPPSAMKGCLSIASRSTTISFSICSPMRLSQRFCGSVH